jgi:restriction endonuclease S subunit
MKLQKARGFDVYSDEGLPFMRVSDYNKFGISELEKKLADSFCKDNQNLIEKLKPKIETILFSKDGSVGIAYMLREDGDFVTSGALLHLKVKDKKRLLPEYLTLVLNSQVVQMQAERDAGGSIILHWHIGEIEQVVVPVVDYEIQQQIAALVEKSFYLCGESERLLKEAKVMGEKEIEK